MNYSTAKSEKFDCIIFKLSPLVMKRAVAIVSGKGGTGKSFVTCNTAVILAGAGFKTLVIDADITMASVEIMYGINPRKTLQDIILGNAKAEEVIHEGPNGVLVAPAGARLKKRLRASELDSAINSIVNAVLPDFLLIDAAAGLDAEVVMAAEIAGNFLIVCNPEITSLADAYKVKSVLGSRSRFIGTVLNRIGRVRILGERISRILGPLIASIPEDPRVRETIDCGVPYVLTHRESIVTKQLFKVASAIAGVELYPEKEKGLLGFLRRKG
jgi:MinD-like ATPase involved in chromosome partitioning or flagellar assembly